MLKRTIVALALVPVLIVVTLFAPKGVAAVVVGLFTALAAYELLYGTKLVQDIRLLLCSVLMAFLVPIWCYHGCPQEMAVLALLVFYILMFSRIMTSGLKVPFFHVAMCTFAGIVVPYMFSSLVRILCLEEGRYVILIPFVVAFMSDTGAYLVGVTMGKHKLCPNISPKKTVEGLIGGLTTAVLAMVVYGLVLEHHYDYTVNYAYVLIYGLLGAACGVFGDLSFSVIKRQAKIKDYGSIFPGHGGVLDRFDSVIVAAPLIEVLLKLLPIIE